MTQYRGQLFNLKNQISAYYINVFFSNVSRRRRFIPDQTLRYKYQVYNKQTQRPVPETLLRRREGKNIYATSRTGDVAEKKKVSDFLATSPAGDVAFFTTSSSPPFPSSEKHSQCRNRQHPDFSYCTDATTKAIVLYRHTHNSSSFPWLVLVNWD